MEESLAFEEEHALKWTRKRTGQARVSPVELYFGGRITAQRYRPHAYRL